MIKVMSIFLICLMLTSCATMGPSLKTPSGRPEVTIYNTTRKEVIDAISNWMLQEFQIEYETPHSIAFFKYDTSFVREFWIGQSKVRITFNVMDVNYGIRVMAMIEIITSDGRVHDFSHRGVAARNLQKSLERVKDSLER